MSIEFLIAQEFPLIKLKERSKLPAEKWGDGERRDRGVEAFVGYNVAVKCGCPVKAGGFLVVVDVDIRNSGDASLQKMVGRFGDLPPTLSVKTGGGGSHYYFKANKPIGKAKLAPGVDLQGDGSYVVAPPSIHESGNRYEFLNKTEIAPIPEWIGEVLSIGYKQIFGNGDGKPFFTASDYVKADPDEIGEGGEQTDFAGRNAYLTSIAGKLRRIGMGEAEIFAALMERNGLKCNPPLPDKEVAAIAKSVMRYLVSEPMSNPEVSAIIAEVPEKINKNSDYKAILDIFAKSQGLVREIADTILEFAPRKYPHYALASAFGIVSAAVQGTYNAPNIGREGESSFGLTLYQWLIAPASAGKEFYRWIVERYCRELDQRLLCPRVGSFYGLRASLYAFNSRMSVIDEIQDEMTRLGASPGGYLYQVLTEMKELSNNVNDINHIVIKDRVYPGIKFPRYSVFGVGTTGGFTRQLDGSLIGGGLLSRFVVWPFFELSEMGYGQRFETIPPFQIKRLARMFSRGITEAGASQDYESTIAAFHGVNDKGKVKSAPEHVPQTLAGTWTVGLEAGARKTLRAFQRQQEALYRRLIKARRADEDLSPGSIIDRSPQVAIKLACLHALGRDSVTIDGLDAEVGIGLASVLSDVLAGLIRGSAGDSDYDRKVAKVMRAVEIASEGGAAQKQFIYKNAHLPSRDIEPILIDLSISQRIQAVNSEGYVVSLDGCRNIPRGIKFMLAPTDDKD